MDYEYFLYSYTKYIYPYIGTAFLVVLGIFFTALILYALKGLGLWRISKAQDVKNFAMSFVPIGSSWLIGIIADKYEAIENKRTTSLRKYILLSGVISYGMLLVFTVVFICVFYYRCMSLQVAGMQMPEILPRLTGLLVGYYVGLLLTEFVQVVHLALYYMALFRVYKLEARKYAVLLLVLSIVIFIAAPVILYILGKRKQNKERDKKPHKRIAKPAFRLQNRRAERAAQNAAGHEGTARTRRTAGRHTGEAAPEAAAKSHTR